ncbi:DNA polymerase III subunit epsilon [Anditalea andensis]|uniref:DNA polymerase III subunit epsilon n=2 Tax=Anditalea andensis TaxID=1048983 RepID=A0A074LJ71_9BACT|nr:DNA polymerase III subunit epsilon [Anditalea andensis]
MRYAIVDIETTGGVSQNGGITEVAVIIHDGTQITDTYQTLINPGRAIPGFITGLTGISNEMVEGAPFFHEIAEDLLLLLKDKVFVAHNVNFDFNFLHLEFQNVGLNFTVPKLCTVKLSRKIFPGVRSYSLGSICSYLGIQITDRHRAYGDALATAHLFTLICERDQDHVVHKSLHKNSGETFLPPHISKEKYDALPKKPGIYYFYDKNNQVIYVGKAINIQSRFKGHFTGKNKTDLKTDIYDVSYELAGSEFLALLLEALEIKRLWPKYNRSQKVKSVSWGVYQYEDGQGYIRFQVSKLLKGHKPLVSFVSHAEAWSYLLAGVASFNLCPKLSGIQKTPRACYDHPIGRCQGACAGEESSVLYNLKAKNWIDSIFNNSGQLLIKEEGRHPQEKAAILFEGGILKAYGFIDSQADIHNLEDLSGYLKSVKPVNETHHILQSFLSRKKMDMVLVKENLLGDTPLDQNYC